MFLHHRIQASSSYRVTLNSVFTHTIVPQGSQSIKIKVFLYQNNKATTETDLTAEVLVN
jgi:hypothetical protein